MRPEDWHDHTTTHPPYITTDWDDWHSSTTGRPYNTTDGGWDSDKSKLLHGVRHALNKLIAALRDVAEKIEQTL